LGQHSSPLLEFADTLEIVEGLDPSYLKKKVCFMEKFRDNIEVIFLVTIFITSLSAITPIT
jgi:hypothetical protein